MIDRKIINLMDKYNKYSLGKNRCAIVLAEILIEKNDVFTWRRFANFLTNTIMNCRNIKFSNQEYKTNLWVYDMTRKYCFDYIDEYFPIYYAEFMKAVITAKLRDNFLRIGTKI